MRLICFGDSLTYGYTSPSTHHPYALLLQKLLSEESNPVHVEQYGTNGMTSEHMASGLEVDGSLEWLLAQIGLTGEDCGDQWCAVILGGTNDLASRRKSADDIFGWLSALHRVCFRAGAARTLALTIPEHGMETIADYRWIADKRQSINERLRELAAHEEEEGQRITLCDIARVCPQHSLDEQERPLMWCSDGLHMTDAGYDRMARAVYQALLT